MVTDPPTNGNGGSGAAERNGEECAPLPLRPQHLAELRNSGLTDATIRSAELHSVNDAREAARLPHWKTPAHDRGPALVFPFRVADGTLNGYTRVKFDRPRTGKNGRLVKYESPIGEPNRVYLPSGTVAALADPSIPLGITEGENKALKADQEGFPCLGLVGVYGWQTKRPKGKDGKPTGERLLIPDLDGIAWGDRAVTIIFDSDAATNPHVLWAEWHLSQALAKRGAKVRVVRLPAGDGGAKVGLDDFLVAHGRDALRTLIADAKPPRRPPSGEPLESDNDPHRLARVVRKGYESDDDCRLVYWSQQFHEFAGGAYRTIPDPDMRALANAEVKREADRLNVAALATWAPEKEKDRPPTAMHVSGKLVGDVLQALAGYCLAPGQVAPPAWLTGVGPFPADELLPCRNGLVHLPTLIADRPGYLLAPTPRLFTFNALGYDFTLDAPPPVGCLNFLGALWSDDQASIDALQEWFDYLLLCNTRQQKILMLIGPKRSGKGTIARVLRALVGPENVAGPTLGSLGTNFGLWPLFGKSVAVISDARLSGRTDSAVVTELPLSISGEDALTVDRKYLTPITTKLNTRLVILTNELPRLSESSGALAGRLIVLRLRNSWYGQKDHELTDRLLGELPGILLWAIAGWQRLRERGRFLQPESGQQLAADMEDLASPVGAFVRECCRVGPECEVEVQLLFSRWRQWCDTKGRKEPGNEQTFGRDLRAAIPSVDVRQPRRESGRVRVYAGIGLRPPGDEEAL